MAVSLWSIGEAHGSKAISPDSEAVGYTVGFLTWILAAGVIVAAKGAAEEMPPWTFCFFRVSLAALVLLPIVRRDHRAMGQFLRHRGAEALFIGAIGLGITQGLLFTSLGYTSAVNVGIIFSTTPIVTMVLAWLLLREAMGPWQVLGSLFAFTGIVVIAVKGSWAVLVGLDLSVGDAFVIVASMTFAGYTVLLKRAKFDLPRLPLLVILMASGAAAAFPFFLYEVFTGQHENLDVNGYLALGYTIVFGGALMYLCFNWSIDILGASRAGGLLYSQMVFTAILAWLILGETLEWYHFVGAGLIVVGIVLVTFLKLKKKPATA
jgi:drug/metabolite transporter (DMT)-like permease